MFPFTTCVHTCMHAHIHAYRHWQTLTMEYFNIKTFDTVFFHRFKHRVGKE